MVPQTTVHAQGRYAIRISFPSSGPRQHTHAVSEPKREDNLAKSKAAVPNHFQQRSNLPFLATSQAPVCVSLQLVRAAAVRTHPGGVREESMECSRCTLHRTALHRTASLHSTAHLAAERIPRPRRQALRRERGHQSAAFNQREPQFAVLTCSPPRIASLATA